ncbi:DOT1-domain-containing protein [Polychaeton citri CBS 116435]|uniref:Histone-lysine N-methyltransferase, H3 lysine-79 specific n=1 Tax=Polychaeton citri CBS 116435 TaxID=1314669 RepID=A0A9P4Q345_9PEZI|nr:DOT1-domain-containing protein [Polychaeton citri CBS 116435]
MNFLGNRNNAGNAKKPVVTTRTVHVPILGKHQGAVRSHAQKQASSTKKPIPRPPPASERFKPSSIAKTESRPISPAQRALQGTRVTKRKSATPEYHLSSDDDSESDAPSASSSDAPRKRIKSSMSSAASSLGPKRKVVLSSKAAPLGKRDFIHGAQLTASDGEDGHKYKSPWQDQMFLTCELQYPTNSPRERFELKTPKNEADDYQPMEDIENTILVIARAYFPEELAEKYLSEEDEQSFVRGFARARSKHSVDVFKAVVEQYNGLVASLLASGKIRKRLASKDTLLLSPKRVELDWIKRILDQTYSRTVSPKVESLRKYDNGTDNVYGELLPRFIDIICEQTNLTDDKVFVDLGSGVGNVVLQAALQIGCESWGIESMRNPCELARLQAREFAARARLWNLNVGKVHLIRGDFTTNEEVRQVLKRADVVLVNNHAFLPDTNNTLVHMFLDLKEGAKVVSLKSFGYLNEGEEVEARNEFSMCNTFVQRQYDYFSDHVSWTNQSGYYYIATKDSGPMDDFQKRRGRLTRR